jgi:lysozyme family protein
MTEIEKTLWYEGGYSNNLNDAGGETNFGISKRQYPNVDIKSLTPEAATVIYERDFFNAMNLAGIDSKRVRWKVFDIGVNAGQKTGAVMLQLVVGAPPDGVIGAKTVSMVNAIPEDFIVDSLAIIQAIRYNGIALRSPSQKKFLNGWLTRANDKGEGL